MDDLYRIYRWWDYYTTDYFFTNLWLDTKYHTQNFLRPIPPLEEREEFCKYLNRLHPGQAIRIGRYHLQKWSYFIDNMETVETFFLHSEKGFEFSNHKRDAVKNRDNLKKYCEALSIAINAGK